MNYLIIQKESAFFTNWYDYENNYSSGMIVINLLKGEVTFNGVEWQNITQDHL